MFGGQPPTDALRTQASLTPGRALRPQATSCSSAAMFGMGFFCGKSCSPDASSVAPLRTRPRCTGWPRNFASLSCGRRSTPPRADPSGQGSATGAARAQAASMSAKLVALLRSGRRRRDLTTSGKFVQGDHPMRDATARGEVRVQPAAGLVRLRDPDVGKRHTAEWLTQRADALADVVSCLPRSSRRWLTVIGWRSAARDYRAKSTSSC